MNAARNWKSWIMAGAFTALAVQGAAQQQYARFTNSVRAGTLLIESQRSSGQPVNYTPHVWYNLDSFRTALPSGWTFTNPRPSTFVTSAIATRWSAFGGSPAEGTTGLGKNAASYWEVRLSEVGDEGLSDFDVLLLAGYGTVSLNPFEREKLRKFVDQGGVLWVDLAGSTVLDPINGLPVPFDATNAGNNNRFVDFLHPVLSYPNTINVGQLPLIEVDGTLGIRQLNLSNIGLGSLEGILQGANADSRQLLPIGGTDAGSFLATAKVGDGYIFVTTRGTARALNRVRQGSGYAANNAFFGIEPQYDRAAEVAAKLVVNAVSLTSGYSQAGQGSRKAGSTPVAINAPLMQSFQAPIAFEATTSTAPVLYKGMLLVTSNTAGGSKLQVFDANPKADLDNDGNPDDGIQDYSQGSNMDMLWESETLPGPISAPLAIEATNANSGLPVDQVVVIDNNGRLYGFDAFQLVAGDIIDQTVAPKAADYTVNPPSGSSSTDVPLAPTYHEGVIFVADNVTSGLGRAGRVWMANPRTGTAIQKSGVTMSVGGAGTQAINEISASPTVGYIPISNGSGGLDRVVYVPTKVNTNGSGPSSHAGIASLWVGARGESPIEWTSSAGTLQITTRAAVQGLNVYVPTGGTNEWDGLGVRITVIEKATGEPLSAAQMNALFSGSPPGEAGNGVIVYTLNAGQTLDQNLYDIRLDYTIDWGTGIQSQTQQIFRGDVKLPDNANRTRRILGQIAMSPRGTIYAVTADPEDSGTTGGSFFAIREEGRGTFKIVTRYDLHDQYSFTPNGGSATNVRETLIDVDPLQQFAPPFLGGNFSRLKFVGGPAVRKDAVYVMARGGKGGFGVPASILMAFKAEPETPEIRVSEIGDGQFTILQHDQLRSTNQATPEVVSQLSFNQFRYERADNTPYGTIRFENLSSANRGPITNTLSTSQPIIIRRQGQPDRVVTPDSVAGSSWNPLLWFAVFHGVRSTTAPFVAGRNVYVSGSSGIASILSGGSPFNVSAHVYAVNGEVPSNDSFLLSSSVRPWQKQQVAVKILGGGPGNFNIQTNPNYLWPQGSGITSFEQYRTRYNQTLLRGSTQAFGVVGGEGMVVSWGNGGIYGFNRADFLVVDEGRVGRYDASGNPIWTSDLAVALGNETGAAGNVRKLVRPVRVYRTGESDSIVVDAGGNRIVRLDNQGREIRSFDRFKVDPNVVPDGFQPNDPLTLNEPRDVAIYSGYRANPTGVSNPQPLEFWRHYVVADSGNRRLVEIIDRYAVDPNTRQIGNAIDMGVLYWHTPANLSGKEFDYSSVTRVFNGSAYVYVAGLGRTSPARADVGLDTPGSGSDREARTGNGGLVVINPASNAVQVIRSVVVPDVAQNSFWNENTQTFSSPAVPTRTIPVGSVNSVTARWVDNDGEPVLAVMYTDNSGVYEIFGNPDAGMVVRWMMDRNVYTKMRGLSLPFGGSGQPSGPGGPDSSNARGFMPLFARRLDSGEVLVVNGYQGQTRGNRQLDGTFIGRNLFQGEVIQLNGDIDPSNDNSIEGFGFGKVNFGFGLRSIRFELPPVSGTRTLLLPVFADRR